MDLPLNFHHLLATITVLLALRLLYKLWRPARQNLPPEPRGALPFIGHLHLLSAKTTLARTFAAMADKYGPIFTIRLGVHRAIIISDQEAIKECFTINDRILASRPRSNAGVHLGYNFAAFGFAPYGEYWREMRKLAMLELLSSRRLDKLKHVQVSEVNEFIKHLYLVSNKAVVISNMFEVLTLNTIIRMIAGKRYFVGSSDDENVEARRVAELIKEFMYISGVLVPSDVVPFLKWVDFGGQVKTMRRVSRELDSLFSSWIDEHELRRFKSETKNENEDFLDLMLAAIEDNSTFGYSRETIIKATTMNIILAGSDTTALTLTWILSNLMNNGHALKLAQEELDLKVGRDRWVQDSDVEKLPYLQAVIKETLRLYPPGPVSVPHEATEDCSVAGYQIPKGSRVFVNLWKLHRDPRVWSNPEEFLPERFLSSHADVDILGQHFELIPFGSGRRSCPGITFALRVTHLAIARLLQGFNLTKTSDAPVDMTEGLGITLPKATPLEVILTPRLPAAFYSN